MSVDDYIDYQHLSSGNTRLEVRSVANQSLLAMLLGSCST